MTNLEYLLKQYENILNWYKQSEDKGKFLVTLNTIIVGVVNGLVFTGADKINDVRPLYSQSIWLLLALSGITLVGSFIFILRAMWPRHHTMDKSLEPNEKIWFFGDIASMTKEEHKNLMDNWSDEDLKKTLIAQNHILSNNVWIKFNALNWSIGLTILSLLLLLVLGITYGMGIANST